MMVLYSVKHYSERHFFNLRVAQRSRDAFYAVTNYIKWATTSWTDSILGKSVNYFDKSHSE